MDLPCQTRMNLESWESYNKVMNMKKRDDVAYILPRYSPNLGTTKIRRAGSESVDVACRPEWKRKRDMVVRVEKAMARDTSHGDTSLVFCSPFP